MGRIEIISAKKLKEFSHGNSLLLNKSKNRPDDIKEDYEKFLLWKNENYDCWITKQYDTLVERECFPNSIYNLIIASIYFASEMGNNSKLMFFNLDFDGKYSCATYNIDERYEESSDVLKMENAVAVLDELIQYFHHRYNGSKKPVYFNKSIMACENKINSFNGYSDNESWQELLFTFKDLIFNGYTIERVECEDYMTDVDVCECYWGNLGELHWSYEDVRNGVREHRDIVPDEGTIVCYRISWNKNAKDIPKITGW